MVTHPLFEGLLGDERVTRVLSEAPQCHVTVLNSTGPHSTRQVFLAWGGRVWLMAGRDTVKAEVLGPRPGTAVLARSGDASVVILGVACLIDPLRPLELLQCIPELTLSGPALAGYLRRNRTDLLGFVRDALGGHAHMNFASSPLLLAVRPRAVALVRGDEVVAAEGRWPGRRAALRPHEPAPGDRPPAPAFGEVPEGVARLLEDEHPCVVGWEGATGPLALPGTWHGHRRVAFVPPELFGLGGLPREGRASVTVDAIDERHSTAKLGVVVRGSGVAVPAGRTMEVRIQPERVTWWQGTDAETKEVA